jgi:antitoxin VapB
MVMKTAELIVIEGSQAVKLPDEFRFPGKSVAVRREGEAVILEPMKPTTWPQGFFESIRIDDPTFVRPEQGEMPPVPPLDEAN